MNKNQIQVKNNTKDSKTAAVKKKKILKKPASLLPKSFKNWKIHGSPGYFTSSNLYKLINGGAEVYREYNLKIMATLDYTSRKHPGITINAQIYEFNDPQGASGRFNRFLTGYKNLSDVTKGLPRELVNCGIFGIGDLIFHKNKYLLHLTLMDENPDATVQSIESAGKVHLIDMAVFISNTILPLKKKQGVQQK